MTIQSVDQALAGMQPPVWFSKAVTPTLVAGRPQSMWYLAGHPGAGALTATLNGGTYSSTSSVPAGSIYHKDPAGGINSYLSRFLAATGQGGLMMLCDRLWDDTLTINSAGVQSITFPGLPSRDINGSANGLGVYAAVEVSAATSATVAALTNYTYTNSAGAGSKTGVFLDAPTAVAAAIGQFYRLTLAAGDQGVQSIQSIQFSTAWTSGTVGLVLYRVIAAVELVAAWVPNALDVLTAGMPQIFNGTCPFLVFVPNTTTAGIVMALYQETQG